MVRAFLGTFIGTLLAVLFWFVVLTTIGLTALAFLVEAG